MTSLDRHLPLQTASKNQHLLLPRLTPFTCKPLQQRQHFANLATPDAKLATRFGSLPLGPKKPLTSSLLVEYFGGDYLATEI